MPQPPPNGGGTTAVAALGVALVGLVALFSTVTVLGSAEVAQRSGAVVFLGAFVIYVLAAAAAHRRPSRLEASHVWIGAVVLRLVMLSSDPILSDDIWRYLWDGHMQLSGVNPYLHAPSSPAVANLHTATWHLVNHPEIPTIYPPVAQAIFAFATSLDPASVAMRAVMVAAELSCAPAVLRLVESRRGPLSKAARAAVLLLLLWNPLTIVEFAGSGHLDALAIAPLLWSLALVAPRWGADRSAPAGSKRWFVAGVMVGLSIGAKLLGAVALAPLAVWALWPRGIRQRRADRSALSRLAALGAGLVLTLTVTFTPYVTPIVFGEAGGFSTAMATYARKWRWNDGLFHVAVDIEKRALTSAAEGPDGDPVWRFDSLAGLFDSVGMTHEHEGRTVASTTFSLGETAESVVKLTVAIGLGLLLLSLLVVRLEPVTVVTVVIATLLLLSPVVHPWYVAWLVPLAVATRSYTLLLWSGLVILTYLPGFGSSPGLLVVEYAPVLLVGSVELWFRSAAPPPRLASAAPSDYPG